jgi:hypothetical protein
VWATALEYRVGVHGQPPFILRGLAMAKSTTPAPPVTNRHLKHIAGEGLERPSSLKAAEVRSLAGAVLSRIEPRGPKK